MMHIYALLVGKGLKCPWEIGLRFDCPYELSILAVLSELVRFIMNHYSIITANSRTVNGTNSLLGPGQNLQSHILLLNLVHTSFLHPAITCEY